MAKTESLKKEDINLEQDLKGVKEPGNIDSKLAVFSNWAFGLTKLIFGICLLPFVYSVSLAFLKELSLIDVTLQRYFWAGVGTLVIIHLLVWDLGIIYTKGHKILEFVFSYFKPLVKVAPYLLPIYAVVLFILYWILYYTAKPAELIDYFVFLLGSSVSLHLIFSAKTLRSKKGDFLKGNYIFGYSFIFIINLMILSFFLNLTIDKFSFVNFTNLAFQIGKDFFVSLFKQLFL